MKKFAKIMSMLLVLSMVLGLAACGAKPETPATTASSDATTSAPAETASGEYVDPFADLADDYDELSQAVYDLVLGDFEKYYNEAMAETSTGVRFAKMAIAEAKLLGAGVFIPTISNGGYFGMSRMAPHSHTLTLWGNDRYRYHDVILTTEPIKASDVQAMREKWNELVGTGEYEDWVKSYLQEQGYTLKNTMGYYFDADPNTWDCMATSNAADTEMLVNTFDAHAPVDVAYYLLNAARHLGVEPRRAPFYVAGSPHVRGEVAAELRKYAAQVLPVVPSGEFNRHVVARTDDVPYDLTTLLIEG